MSFVTTAPKMLAVGAIDGVGGWSGVHRGDEVDRRQIRSYHAAVELSGRPVKA